MCFTLQFLITSFFRFQKKKNKIFYLIQNFINPFLKILIKNFKNYEKIKITCII